MIQPEGKQWLEHFLNFDSEGKLIKEKIVRVKRKKTILFQSLLIPMKKSD